MINSYEIIKLLVDELLNSWIKLTTVYLTSIPIFESALSSRQCGARDYAIIQIAGFIKIVL